MKKIILLILTLVFSTISFAQLANESFEAAIFPPTTPANWAVFDNGVSGATNINWSTTTVAANVNSGLKAAFMNRQQPMASGLIAEDYLATPAVTVPNNGQLKFFTRTLLSGIQAGTKYLIKVKLVSAGPQNDPNGYNVIQTWTDANFLTNYQVYEEKTLNLTGGTQVYIAFVLQQTGNGSPVGNRWLVDDVRVVAACTAPLASTFTTAAITDVSATLGWAAVPGAVGYQIENVLSTATPTGTFTGASSTNSFPQQGLTALTSYQFFVRSDCGGGNFSPWSGPLFYTTTIAPPACGGTFYDTGGATANYSNNETGTPPITITPPPGQQVTVTFTNFSTEANTDILRVYNGDTVNAATLIGTYSGNTNPGSITATNPVGYLTFSFTSNGFTTLPGWEANVTCTAPPSCQKPIALVTSNVQATTATLSWGLIGNAVSYEIFYQVGNTPPTAGTVAQFTSNTNSVNLTGLLPNTLYNFYVRSVCAGNDFSLWSNPTSASTSALPPVCGGNYVDTGGPTGNYGNNENIAPLQICPNQSNPNEKVTVTFTSFDTEVNYDGMYVYDGSVVDPLFQIESNNLAGTSPNVAQPGAYWGTTIPGPFTSTSADGCLTFVFTSDGSVIRAGWNSNITCALPPTCQVPTTLITSSTLASNISLSWTQSPNPDNTTANAWRVIALPCGSPTPAINNPNWVNTNTNPHIFNGLTANTCYDFYVQAICSATDSSTIAGPKSSFTPLTCLNNFFDAGGLNANYLVNENTVTTICPTLPTDIVIVQFTSFNVDPQNDGLYVFDGNDINDPQIATTNSGANVPGGLNGPYWGTALPGPFVSGSPDGCLTFRFRSNGFTQQSGWAANVTCVPRPTCSRPYALSANNINQTSATLNWLQPQNPNGTTATSWEVLVLPAGSPIPTTNGIPTNNPFQAGGLTPGTAYVYYVRAICSSTDSSLWSSFNFATTPVNDECTNATFAIVNQNLNCVQTTPGTITGATVSTQASNCVIRGNNDVWFSFTATAITHIISFNNVAPGNLQYAIYQGGNCGALTQISCNSGAGLVAGTTYLIRVYSVNAGPQILTFDLCIGTLPCSEAPAFCTGQTVTYANTTNVPSLGQIGCLFTSPNPAFFFLQVNQAGPLNYLISQVDTGGTPRDVDYVAWGPFTDLATACTGVPANPLPGILPALTPAGGCQGTIHACSYSANPTEIMCIPNAQLCEVYVVMITNFSNAAGTVTFTQSNSGGGTTACFPINTFNYLKNAYCQNEPNPTPVLANGASAGTYTATPAGLSIDPVTGTINLLASLPGAYIVTSTTQTSTGGACTNIPTITTTRTVIITAPASATITYVPAVFCSNITTQQSVTLTGTPNGNFSATPAGLSINSGNGDILPIASNPAVYTVTYTVPPTGGCPAFITTTTVEIKASPVVSQPSNVNSCTNYVLPAIPVGNYYSQSGGLGVAIPAGTNITTSQTIYIYASNGICSDEKSFTIGIGSGSTPVVGFSYTSPVCNDLNSPAGSINPSPTGAALTSGGTFSCLNPALILNATTGAINLSSPQGNYTITYTVAANPSLCLSAGSSQATLTINPILTPVTGFSYTTPVCRNNANLTPTTATGFTTGGTYSATPAGLVINASTGLISNTSLSGTYTIKYEVAADPNGNVCRAAGFSTAQLVIEPVIVAASTLNYSATNNFCTIGTANPTPIISTTYTYDGVASTTIPTPNPNVTFIYTVTPPGLPGLDINPATGEINLANSLAGSYVVTYTATGAVPNCYSTNLIQVTVNIIAPLPVSENFSYTSPVCKSDIINPTPNPQPVFAGSNSFSSTAGLSLNTATGEINLLNSIPGTYQVNYFPVINPSTCAIGVPSSATITINPVIVPIFNTISVCQGTASPSFPINYISGTTTITGNWNASSINTATVGATTYTFTPNAGQCADNGFLIVNVTPPSINPTFTTISACQGTTPPSLPANFTNGSTTISGSWSPSITSTSTVGANTYTFIPNPGQCANNGTLTLNVTAPSINPTFATKSVCQGTAAPSLPANYTNGSTVITGIWSPSTVSTATLGAFTYTFTPNAGQCANNGTLTVNVTPPSINPTFATIPVCQGTAAPSLPVNYTNGSTVITGSWSPLTVSTATLGASTYTFTPDAGQCANNGTLTVNVTPPSITPTFAQMQPICQGDPLPVLTSSSNNTPAITGTWTTTGNTTNAGTILYNFVPNAGQCALPTSMTITIIPNPIFTISGACQGGAFTLEVAGANSNASYSWLKGTMPVGSNASTLVVTEIADYYCTVTENGCSTKSPALTPNDIICSIQKGISPNNDGLNDAFDLSAFDVNKLEIFNRYGMLVYAKSGYKKEWLGQADSGETLPDGTYFYMISLNKGESKTGWIYINKQNNN